MPLSWRTEIDTSEVSWSPNKDAIFSKSVLQILLSEEMYWKVAHSLIGLPWSSVNTGIAALSTSNKNIVFSFNVIDPSEST